MLGLSSNLLYRFLFGGTTKQHRGSSPSYL
ncbi:hypothetical protein NC652_003907 [Populus alba x Populus x berolinensis]|uniref:Uncharacterized protein n=1 Tax=Populus alba x Populus x berolinensis TaxID=444605 RepID=A0AAD6RSW6_9ROSI|nr:hypothetical protein NC652_003907 [Populus alba x Populus x berolinensis]KAJ7014459.1 hypothetical protein NC653_003932 [Populus alba x Populus x berolinensis]